MIGLLDESFASLTTHFAALTRTILLLPPQETVENNAILANEKLVTVCGAIVF